MTHKDSRGDVFTDRSLFDEALIERKLYTTSKSSVMTETRLQAGVPVAEWDHITRRGVIFSEAVEEDAEVSYKEKPKGIVKPITEPGDVATVVAGATMMAESSHRPRADEVLIEKLSGDTSTLSTPKVAKIIESAGFDEKIVASALGGAANGVSYYHVVTEAEELFGLYGVRIVGEEVNEFDAEDSGVFEDLQSAKKEMARLASKPMTEQKLLAEGQAARVKKAASSAAKGIGKALWHASGASDVPALSSAASAAARLRASRARKREAAARLARQRTRGASSGAAGT